MTNLANFEKQLADAEKAGNKQSAQRLRFIIQKQRRNTANRDEKQQTRKRKAEDDGTGPYKAMRFTDSRISMGTVEDMIQESHARDQAEMKKREEARLKTERARKTAESQRKRREYQARQAERERQDQAEKDRKAKEERDRKDKARRERDERFRQKPPPKSQPPPPRSPPRSPPRPTPTRRPAAPLATMHQINTWRTFSLNCFADYSKVLTFPAPPGGCCSSAECQAAAENRVLEACDCHIRLAFRNARVTNFRMERLKWHPDRFGQCVDEKRAEFERKAKEMFVVVDGLYQGR
ncbi:hypothetical protein CLAFUR4_14505 [Fulvia fulva]|nr:hypothetical protein CLAFUR4_14505 [Fulvia fulva]WPV37581.1 hypothetical protein CLAFUW7_14514 [Fulvia fulva]